MYDIHDEFKCNLQGKINEESDNIIIDSNPQWCPLLIEDYHISLNVDNESIGADQMEEFNKSIENINSQLDTLKNASADLSKLIDNIKGDDK
jgi:hypothetical protein